jgi:hypothetical protein
LAKSGTGLGNPLFTNRCVASGSVAESIHINVDESTQINEIR